jgi:hypothetical protein
VRDRAARSGPYRMVAHSSDRLLCPRRTGGRRVQDATAANRRGVRHIQRCPKRVPRDPITFVAMRAFTLPYGGRRAQPAAPPSLLQSIRATLDALPCSRAVTTTRGSLKRMLVSSQRFG